MCSSKKYTSPAARQSGPCTERPRGRQGSGPGGDRAPGAAALLSADILLIVVAELEAVDFLEGVLVAESEAVEPFERIAVPAAPAAPDRLALLASFPLRRELIRAQGEAGRGESVRRGDGIGCKGDANADELGPGGSCEQRIPF